MKISRIKSINEKFYYGWVIVLMAALGMFFSAPGQTYSISAFMEAYITDLGYSRTLISSVYSVATILSGTLIVFMGKAIDRNGQRKMSLIVGILLALTCLFNSFISNVAMMAIGFFLLRYLGQGSMTLIPSTLVPQWFEKKRALAFSLMNLGGMAANMVIPAINIYFITHYSWALTWRLWAMFLVIGFLPLAYVLIVNRPEDIGTRPDNENNTILSRHKDQDHSWTLNEALKTKEFWFVGIISMMVPMISTGLMFHFFSIMATKMILKSDAAYIIGLIALPGFIMPLVSGLFIDRFRTKYVITSTLIGMGLSLVFLNQLNTLASAAVFMLVYGLFTNIQGVSLNVIWPRYFGRSHLGSIRGAATIFMVIGSALGPLPFGLSYDLSGSYSVILYAMSGLCLSAISLSLSIRKPKKNV